MRDHAAVHIETSTQVWILTQRTDWALVGKSEHERQRGVVEGKR